MKVYYLRLIIEHKMISRIGWWLLQFFFAKSVILCVEQTSQGHKVTFITHAHQLIVAILDVEYSLSSHRLV